MSSLVGWEGMFVLRDFNFIYLNAFSIQVFFWMQGALPTIMSSSVYLEISPDLFCPGEQSGLKAAVKNLEIIC